MILEGKPEERKARNAWTVATEAVLVTFLVTEVSVLCLYYGFTSLVILVGPGGLEPSQTIALAFHLIVTVLCLITLFGIGYCYFGVITLTSPVKRLSIALALLNVLVLPTAIYTGAPDSVLHPLRFLAVLGILIFINTIAAFYYIDSRGVIAEQQ